MKTAIGKKISFVNSINNFRCKVLKGFQFNSSNNFMKKILLSAGLFVFSLFASAQQYIDLASFSYASSSLNTFDSSNATTGLTEMNGDFTLPIVLNDKATILTGVTYESVNASFNPGRSKETITGITLKAGANLKHNDKLSGTYMLLPKISSDFEKIGRNDFQFGGVVLMKYEKSDHFNYKFGAYTNTELFGQFLVPIFGFYYLNPSEKLEVKVLLPLAGNLNYALTKSTSVGINFKGQIRSYNINTLYGAENDRYIARSTNEATTYLQYSLKSGINFKASVGRSIARSFRAYDEKVAFGMPLTYFGDNRTQLNSDFSDSWLFQFSVFYRLNLKPKS